MLDSRHPLAGMLAVAVAAEIDRLKHTDEEFRAHLISEHTSRIAGTLLGEKGDVLLYGGRGCAEVFAALARGLACLAWASGGVTAFGMHFCVRHEECERAELAARKVELMRTAP